MKEIFFSIICFVFFLNATAQDTPRSIEEALYYLENSWSTQQKDDFKNSDEKAAVTSLHFSVGMSIRNSWLRQENVALRAEFDKLQVYHRDDISSIILTSFHRKLNNKPLELEKQAQHYIDYWKPYLEQEFSLSERADEIVNKFKIGNTINLYYPIEVREDGGRNAVFIYNDEDWEFNPETDLKVTGILREKKDYLFTIEVTKINKKNVTLINSKVDEGESYTFNIRYVIID
ncbi:MAG TPA: DUF6794 domain-containing protein [Flavobacterium sp.]|nr:DUF6794 domain-containing protein [Flavobacterium sp.]